MTLKSGRPHKHTKRYQTLLTLLTIPNMTFEQFLTNDIRVHQLHLNIVTRSNLESFDDLLQLTSDTVSDYCHTLRRPGGIIPDPRDPNNPAVYIQNPGCPISQITERRLTLAVFAAHYYDSIGRPVDNQTMSWARIQHFATYITIRKNYLAPAEPSAHLSGTSFATTIEIIENHLARTLGSTKLPLAYVIRPTALVSPIALHPLNQLDTLPYASIHFSGFNEELIARTPHTTAEFETDNSMVFTVLLNVFGKTKYVSSLQPFRARHNGRAAYLALLQHNLGSNQYQVMFHDAESIVCTHKYFGTNAHYTLGTHIAKHRSAHDRMRRASSNVNFALPTETTRVLRLLQSLETSDIAILSAKTAILGDPVKKANFELTADFLITVAPSSAPPKKSHRISSLKSGKHGRSSNYKGNRHNGRRNNNYKDSRYQPYVNPHAANQSTQQFTPTPNRGTTGVELRYYNDSEYRTLNHPQKNELRLWRKSQNQPITISALQQYFQHPVPQPQLLPPTLPPPPTTPVTVIPQQIAPPNAIIPFTPPPGQNAPDGGRI